MALALPHRPLTAADLDNFADDGHRYELLDGCLIVTPAPGTAHQICVGRLHTLLDTALGPQLTVLVAPYDYLINPATVVQPDLLVARTEDLGPANLQNTPHLVIEVLSPTTRHLDLGAKRLLYANAGVAHYWIVDPDEPSLTALTLHPDSTYHTSAHATGDAAHTDADLGVTVIPAQLTAPRR